jgi:DNA-binding transcriptional LysR family regulator
MQKQSWDDLQLVLALVEGGGLSGAARTLGVHHATVLRRLDIFERKMGVVLFDRKATGYIPTVTGEAFARHARDIALHVDDAYRMLVGRDARLSGVIRLAAPDFIAQTLIPKAVHKLHQLHPSIEVEVVVSSLLASLSKRDADVALRILPQKTASDNLAGQCLGQIKYGVFARAELLTKTTDIMQLPWVADDISIAQSSTTHWRETTFNDAAVVTRANNMMSKYAAIRNSVGVGFLPLYLGKMDPALELLDARSHWTLDLWYLTHRDLNNLPRIRALRKVMRQEATHALIE